MLPLERIVFSNAPFISFNPRISTAFDEKNFTGTTRALPRLNAKAPIF
jgi:hypothetical protein